MDKHELKMCTIPYRLTKVKFSQLNASSKAGAQPYRMGKSTELMAAISLPGSTNRGGELSRDMKLRPLKARYWLTGITPTPPSRMLLNANIERVIIPGDFDGLPAVNFGQSDAHKGIL